MTTTNTYNPILSALRELTTPAAFRWYGTQTAKAATLAYTIALKGFTTAKHWFSPSPSAIAAIAEPEIAITMPSVIAPTETITQTIAPAVQDDGDAVERLESAITPQESAFTEATELAESPTSYDWEAIEMNDTAFATAQDDVIAQTNEPEQCDRIAGDEVEVAFANDSATEAHEWGQADVIASVAFSESGTRGFSDATADDGDALGWVDEDPTERRYWAEAEDLGSAIAQTTEPDEEDDTFFSAEPEPAEDFADDADDEADELE